MNPSPQAKKRDNLQAARGVLTGRSLSLLNDAIQSRQPVNWEAIDLLERAEEHLKLRIMEMDAEFVSASYFIPSKPMR